MDFSDLFSSDTWNTIQQGMGTAGSAWSALAPLLNMGGQVAAGLEGTNRQRDLINANQATLGQLNEIFAPTGTYAQELRNQLERKDAAAGRRSQYGTRETQLMAQLAKERANTLTSPLYQMYLTGANRSPYGPIAGAFGNLTGGQQGQGGQQQGGGAGGMTSNPLSTANSVRKAYNFFSGLGAGGADASIAGLGGAAGFGEGGSLLGATDTLGSLLGGTGQLPTYGAAGGPQGGGIFGQGGNANALTGAAGTGLDLLGGAGAFGGAGGALSGMGAGSLAGTVGATDALGALAGGTGFLPGYGATAGSSLFGAGAGGAGAGAAGGAGGAAGGSAAGGASGAAGGLGAAAGAALPIAVLIGGLMSMFQSGTQPEDITGGWAANAPNLNKDNFNQYMAEDPTLGALVNMSMTNGQFDYNKYNEALQRANVGGKAYTGNALAQGQQFGQTLAQNPSWFQGPAAMTGDWQSELAQTYGGE